MGLLALLAVPAAIWYFGRQAPAPDPTPASAPAEAQSAGAAVEPASAEQEQLIQRVLRPGITMRRAFAVRSPDHPNAYYAAARLYGAGLDDGPAATWIISGAKAQPGMILSVDGLAAQFSSPRPASETRADASIADPAAERVRAHAAAQP